MKIGLIVAVLLTGVSAFGFSQTAFTVRNTATWIEAVNGIRNGGNDKEYKITVTGTVSVPASAESTFGSVTGVTITIEGNGTISLSNNGNLLFMGAGQTIVAKDLTLKGRDNNNRAVVFIQDQCTFRMEGKASITGNASSFFGGGVFINGGTFIMQDSARVSGNTAKGSDPEGGGIFINGGTFTMRGGTVSDNTAGWGGGVYLNKGSFTMQGGSVSSNTANSNADNGGGGGVYVGKSTFTMEGGTISGNVASTKYGGGVYITSDGTFTMQGSASVSGNKTIEEGGGVFNRGTFAMKDNTSVSGNTSYSSSGGGVSNRGTFTMQDSASVSGNTARWGGGVFVISAFTMLGGSVSSNTAIMTGGGVYVHGTFTMQDSASVSGNTAYGGGGVFISTNGTFTKTGGTISGDDAEQGLKNTAISGRGFAVYEDKNKGWRNAGAGPTINPGSYGFWLNEEAAATGFSPNFNGVWKRNNFNNTLTITTTTAKSSSRDVTWKFISASGDSYTLEANTAAKTKLTLTIKNIKSEWRGEDDYLQISGDSGSGENNWNGDWYKHYTR